MAPSDEATESANDDVNFTMETEMKIKVHWKLHQPQMKTKVHIADLATLLLNFKPPINQNKLIHLNQLMNELWTLIDNWSHHTSLDIWHLQPNKVINDRRYSSS